jgi:hypothetical protein
MQKIKEQHKPELGKFRDKIPEVTKELEILKIFILEINAKEHTIK